jgi:hypothetical protein
MKDYDNYVDAEVQTLAQQTFNITVFRPAYWNATPNVGDPRWCYDIQTNNTAITWQELTGLLVDAHLATEIKEKSHMVNGCSWKPLTDYTVITKTTQYGKTFVTKCANNVVDTSLFILDYDSGITMEEVRQQLGDLQHIGYTSYNHQPSHHKFRIVIPLTTPIPIHLLRKIKDSEISILPALHDKFGSIDLTTFDLARSFFMPSCPQANMEYAKSWVSEGRLFDWTVLPITTTFKKKFVSGKEMNSTDILQLFRDNGLYQGPLGGKKHQVTCPWSDTHTNDKSNGAVVWEGEGFCCKHSHCINKTYKELLEALGVRNTSSQQHLSVFEKWKQVTKEV